MVDPALGGSEWLTADRSHLELLARVAKMLVIEDRSEIDLLEAVFGEVAHALGAEMYFSYEPFDAESMRLCAWGGLTNDERARFEIMRYGELLCGQVAAQRRRIVIEDIPNSTATGSEAVRAAGYGAYAGFPLIAKDRLLGTIAFITRSKTHFDVGDIETVSTVCDQVSATLARIRIEDQLRSAHDTFRHLVEHSPFGVYVVDADFRLVHVSAGAQPVFAGVRPLLGRDLAEVLRIVWPEPFATEAIGHFHRTLATGEPYHAPSTVERRHDIDETEAYDWKLERLGLPDGRLGVVCHFYDLSERLRYENALREREERLEQAMTAAAAGSWTLIIDTGEFIASDRALELHGLPPGTAMTRESALMCVHPDDRAAVQRAVTHVCETGEMVMTEHRVGQTKDSMRWVTSHAERRTGHDGRSVVVGLVQDVTIRKRAEEILRAERQREGDIALSLQRALLPAELPDHPFVQIGHRYSAGGDGLVVGGDWYDAIAFEDGRIGITVGDVVGHGLAAAAAMGKLRTVVAALAPGRSPAALLEALDGFRYRTNVTDFATVCYALYDPATGQLDYASAGHPPMLVVSPEGAVHRLDAALTPPMCGPTLPRQQTTTVLEPGSVLLMYSDGLIERTGERISDGLDRLENATQANARLPVQDICENLHGSLHVDDSAHEDDVVVVAVRVARASATGLRFVVPAAADHLQRARAAIHGWIEVHSPRNVGSPRVELLQVTVGEAVTGVMKQAELQDVPGTVEVALDLSPEANVVDARIVFRPFDSQPAAATGPRRVPPGSTHHKPTSERSARVDHTTVQFVVDLADAEPKS